MESGNGKLKLADARERTPAPQGLGAWAEAMKGAALDALAPDDITEIVAAQVAKAKKGDPAAAKFVLGFVQGQVKATSPPPPPAIALQPVEHPDPPKSVVIASQDADQQRLLVAMILLSHQPMSVAGLAQLSRIDAEQLDALLNHEWFARQNGSVKLTTVGRSVVG